MAGYSVLCRSSIVRLVQVVVGANRGGIFQGDTQFIGCCGWNWRPASGGLMEAQGLGSRRRSLEMVELRRYMKLEALSSGMRLAHEKAEDERTSSM